MTVIVQELGYAQYPYATENYASGIVDAGDGIQFLARIDTQAARGVQHRQRIDVETLAGVQALARITRDVPAGAQFRGEITQEPARGIQATQRIDLEPFAGVQFSGLRNDFDAPRGLQFVGVNPTGQRVAGAQANLAVAPDAARGAQFRASTGWAHYQCSDGYATTDYATTPYLVASICATGGIQWQQRVDVEADVGVQWSQLINPEPATGLQFRGLNPDAPSTTGLQWRQRIDREPPTGLQFSGQNSASPARGFQFRAARGWTHYQCSPGYAADEPYATQNPYLAPFICATGGMQFLGRNTVESARGVQWQQRIDTTKLVGFQWQQRIDKDVPVGVQFDAIQAKPVAFQFRVTIYNTTNLRILYQFPSRGTSGTNWTASSTASSSTNAFSPNNLNTDIVEQVWRSGAPNNAILTCDTQVTQGVFVDTLAILNHNFGGNTVVRLEKSTNNIVWELESVLEVERENMYYIAPSLPLQSYRYWRLVLSDSTLSFFQIGTIVFGSSVVFQGECFTDTVRFGRRQFADKVFTEGHTNVANDRGKKRYLGLDFKQLNFGRANFQQLRDVFEATGTLLKALWIPTPQTPSRFAVFGKLEELPEETHNTRGDDYVDVAVKVDESL